VPTLREAIAAGLADPGDVVLARAILGGTDVAGIAGEVERFVGAELGARVAGCPLFAESVGAVFVLDLDDGRRVVLKAHPAGELTAVYRAQQHLADAGFPCARVLVGPRPWPAGVAAIMSYLEAPPAGDAHLPATRRALAGMLWRSAELAAGFDDAALAGVTLPAGAVFPPAHNALFDLAAPGGEWIDARARAARAVLDTIPERPLVIHTDVSAANVRVADGVVVAVFDMDSVARVDEMRALAGAAVDFTYTGEPGATLPTRHEASEFVADYLRARGHPLDAAERARLDAAAIYAMAYTARCEHALGGGAMCMALRSAPDAYVLPL
jgi:hypothetical protein